MASFRPERRAARQGVSIRVTDARGGERVGLMLVLVISTMAAAIGLIGFWAIDSHHMNSDHRSHSHRVVRTHHIPPRGATAMVGPP